MKTASKKKKGILTRMSFFAIYKNLIPQIISHTNNEVYTNKKERRNRELVP